MQIRTQVISLDGIEKRLAQTTFDRGHSLCEWCAKEDCTERGRVQLCVDTILPITFTKQAQKGFEKRSNTIRPGKAWEQRLFGGDKVALVDSKTQEPFAIVEVLGVFRGRLDEILLKHAKYNHMMQDVPEEEAPARLKELLMKFYGPRIISDDREVSVIYLEAVSD